MASTTILIAVAALLAPSRAARGMGGMGSRHSGEIICATFDVQGTTIDVIREGLEMFVRGNSGFWTNESNTFTELHIDLSSECQRGTIYKSVFVVNNPIGHPTIDFFGGGYGIPHWDVHFFTVSVSDTEAGGSNDMTSCVTTNIPIQCDPQSTDPRNVAFLLPPPVEYVPEAFSLDFQFGGHSIIGHGTHWIEDVDFAPGGPAHYTVNGVVPNPAAPGPPGWVACAQQAPDVNGQTDFGCRYGVWSGFSQIFLTHNGDVLGHEPMVSHGLIERISSAVFGGSVARVSRNYPQAQRASHSGMSAQQLFVEVESTAGEDESVAKIGLVLGKSGKGGKGARLSAMAGFAESDALGPIVAASAVGLVAAVALVGYRARRKAAGYEKLEYAESGTLSLLSAK